MGDLSELFTLAGAVGVQTRYWDTRGVERTASPDALIGVLRAIGVPVEGPDDLEDLRGHVGRERTRVLPPVIVAWQGDPIRFNLCTPEHIDPRSVRVEVAFEQGGVQHWDVDVTTCPPVEESSHDGVQYAHRGVELGGAFVDGYHQLFVELHGARHEATVLVAPRLVVGPEDHERSWGVFAPLYSLRSESGSNPSLRDLDELAAWLHGMGGTVIATLPLLATFLDRPFDPSPYTPVSRRFWNELFVDLDEVGGLRTTHARNEAAAMRWEPSFDYAREARLVESVLSAEAQSFFEDPGRERAEFDLFVSRRPEALDYARFRATVERRGTGWHEWPARQRGGQLDAGDFDEARMRYHLVAQYLMDAQVRGLTEKLTSRGQRLYLDLPVGSHGDGYDTWRHADLFGWGAATGAPPDDFFSEGQNWGFPPLRPSATRDEGHRFIASCLRHHMQASTLLRLDHIMQLHRLWWVPDGGSARDGVYVRYPREELFAVVAIESHRHGCTVVGEDLGTVPDEVREAMSRHGMLGMYVAQFQIPAWAGAELADPPQRSVASIDTHDTPTFAGFLRGLDIARRHEVGLIDATAAAREHAERFQQVENLKGFLAARGMLVEPGDDHELLRALLRQLGQSEAATVLVALEDLLGQSNPQNIPGTGIDRPNWVQKLPLSIAGLAQDRSVVDDLELLARSRLAAHPPTTEAHR